MPPDIARLRGAGTRHFPQAAGRRRIGFGKRGVIPALFFANPAARAKMSPKSTGIAARAEDDDEKRLYDGVESVIRRTRVAQRPGAGQSGTGPGHGLPARQRGRRPQPVRQAQPQHRRHQHLSAPHRSGRNRRPGDANHPGRSPGNRARRGTGQRDPRKRRSPLRHQPHFGANRPSGADPGPARSRAGKGL